MFHLFIAGFVKMSSPVADYFAGKTLMLTGGTGFIGKVLVEKILRCCPDVDKIYLLIRPKAGQDPVDRIKKEFSDCKVRFPVTIGQSIFTPSYFHCLNLYNCSTYKTYTICINFYVKFIHLLTVIMTILCGISVERFVS